ncbi:MAG: MFS transporter [Reyranella sp.]|uniref:MFS transporter n=1 Tax=Reyranella sp. TaxID=1929291 RepID=UPI002730FF76|nr:MFS transporter [Reyranella sp.]MDP1966439.1 MFS transporter [Reyranella sp.]MDP2375844.1 MFS transporter [Reyranella sp.]
MIRSYVALVRNDWRPLAFGIVCAFLSSPGQTFFISLFIGAAATDLGLGATELGSLYMVGTIGAASLLPLTGHWIDRLDLRLYTLLVMAGLAAACGVMAMASGPVGLVAGLLLLRLTGQGLTTHVAVTSIARYFRHQRGRALSLVAMGFPLSQGVLPTAAVMLGATDDWRRSYALIGVAVLLMAAPILLWLIRSLSSFTRPTDIGSGVPSRVLDGLRIMTRSRFFWFALPLLLYMPFASTALVFHIQAIAAAKGWSHELVALGFAAYALSHASTLLLIGGLIDRLGATTMLPTMIFPMLFGLAALGLLEAPPVMLLFLGLMGMSSGLAQTTVTAVWAEIYGVGRLGTIRSFATMLMVAGTALGPVAIGALLDSRVSVAAICGALIAFGLSSALLARIGVRRRTR